MRQTLLLILMASLSLMQESHYAVLVNFRSMGTGVPSDKPLLAYVRAFREAHQQDSIQVDRIGPLGREGEYAIGFRLSELNSKQKKAFIQGLKKIRFTTGKANEGSIQVTEQPTDAPQAQTRTMKW